MRILLKETTVRATGMDHEWQTWKKAEEDDDATHQIALHDHEYVVDCLRFVPPNCLELREFYHDRVTRKDT